MVLDRFQAEEGNYMTVGNYMTMYRSSWDTYYIFLCFPSFISSLPILPFLFNPHMYKCITTRASPLLSSHTYTSRIQTYLYT